MRSINSVHGRDVLDDARLIELLALLIANGVSLRGKSSYGESAVRVLSRLGRFDAVRMLLDSGADPDDVAFTPLFEAVAFGSLEDVERTIARGANLEERDHWERTAWIVAVQIGDIDKAERLRAAGAAGECTGAMRQARVLLRDSQLPDRDAEMATGNWHRHHPEG